MMQESCDFVAYQLQRSKFPGCEFSPTIALSSSIPCSTHTLQIPLSLSQLLLLLVDLLVVEGELLILKNVTVSTTALTGTRGNASQDLARRQLLDHILLVHNRFLSLLHLGNRRLALALHLGQIVLHYGTLGIDLARVVLLKPRLEGGGIDRHDAALHDRVGAHQLVVGRVVHDVQNLGLGRES